MHRARELGMLVARQRRELFLECEDVCADARTIPLRMRTIAAGGRWRLVGVGGGRRVAGRRGRWFGGASRSSGRRLGGQARQWREVTLLAALYYRLLIVRMLGYLCGASLDMCDFSKSRRTGRADRLNQLVRLSRSRREKVVRSESSEKERGWVGSAMVGVTAVSGVSTRTKRPRPQRMNDASRVTFLTSCSSADFGPAKGGGVSAQERGSSFTR